VIVISVHSVIIPSTLLMHTVRCVVSIQYVLQSEIATYGRCAEDCEGFVNWFPLCF